MPRARSSASRRRSRSAAVWRAALLLAAACAFACRPPFGGAGSAAEAAPDGPAADALTAGATVVDVGAGVAGGAGGGSGVAPAGGEAAPLSRFGILTPLFPGVASEALGTGCEPDDFYGGCL